MFNLTRGEELTALIAVTVVGLAVATVSLHRGDKGRTVEIPLKNPRETFVQEQREQGRGKITVHVSGEVHRDGVLELSAGSRVSDAIELAGATEEADMEALNLAALLLDGEHIVVPRKGGATPRQRPASHVRPGTVNINTANQQQLESLPGIGPVVAKRIIEYRQTRKFDNVDELLLIRGIGPKILERVREYVCVK